MANRTYTAVGTQNAAPSAGVSLLSMQSTVAIRPTLDEFTICHSGTMADATIQHLVRRFNTSDGTATAVTPSPVDPSDGAAVVVVQHNHTAEPTVGVTLLDLHVHLRSIVHWRSNPRYPLVMEALATTGIVLTPIHASQTNLCTGTVWFTE